MSVARIEMLKSSKGQPLGQAAVYFDRPDDAVTAAEDYHGRFMKFGVIQPNYDRSNPVSKYFQPRDAWRRVGVHSDELGANVVRESYTPEEPTREGLKDYVRRKAVGGEWPKSDKFGMIAHKNRYRRYKPPGNPKPRHG